MFQQEYKLLENRCRLFINRTLKDRFFATIPLTARFGHTVDPVPYKDRLRLDYKPIAEGADWGNAWESAWFHFTASVPAEWRGKELAVALNLSGEALIFDDKGVPFYALTGNSVFNTWYYKDLFFVPETMVKNGQAEFWAEVAANSLFGIQLDEDPHSLDLDLTGKFPGKVLEMRLGLFNREAWLLRLEFEVIYALFGQMKNTDYRYRQLLHTMNAAIDAYGDDARNAAKARAVLKPQLELPATASALSVAAVGHAHIDVGWLWPVRESIRKAARTFSSQLELIKQYPGYIFGASQPQLYAFVRDHYPELFAKIKAAVADGTWELQGGMWVEADCNIIGGEAMIRQFVHGKNFFMDEFGVDVRNLWLPDVFGYSAALPQIIRKAGCEYFLTQKISWSQYNTFPHHTFVWRGIDGSEVLTHFPPEDTYNAFVTPAELVPAQNKYAQADVVNEFASLFGLGDGGGGPAEAFLERAKLVKNLEGCPKLNFSKTSDFFERINPSRDKFPKWDGELYLEMHRGTLTTQARTKRNNRKLEELLVTAEFMWSCLDLSQYPAKELDAQWKILLLNQFHDIIPGSSIRKVYEVTEAEHASAIAVCTQLIERAAEAMSVADPNAAMLVNTLSDPYRGTVKLPAAWADAEVRDQNGLVIPTQYDGETLLALVDLPGSGITTLRRGKAATAAAVRPQTKPVLENELIRYTFNQRGELVSAFDKCVGRELIEPGQTGNLLQLFVDRPNNFDAWDVDSFYKDGVVTDIESATVSDIFAGPVESSLKLDFIIGQSRIDQKVTLRAKSKRLDFVTHVDWHETRKLLQVRFAAKINATEGNYDIQYGYLRRALHENTSWDMAKFEVPARRYVDISERNYGVALLNDCKYGCRAEHNGLHLSLLRSPLYPDPTADRGDQYFTYSYLPHEHDLIDSTVMAESAMLNRLPVVIAGRAANKTAPFSVESATVGLEVVKRAEKSDRLVIRLAERSGNAAGAVLRTTLAKDLLMVETNLMEWTSEQEFRFAGGELHLQLKPFEIKTLIVAK